VAPKTMRYPLPSFPTKLGLMSRARLLALVLVVACPLALAQEPAPAPVARQNPQLLAELYRDLWLPFTESYADQEAEAYVALLAPDFIRVDGDRKGVRNFAEYTTAIRRTFAGWLDREEKAGISFRFFERIVRGDLASERGVYELTLADNDGNVERIYGQFHVIARKIEGRWRMVVDYDSTENGSIDRGAFLAAAAVDDFKRF
jgi:ketosteroid isomerase-like protein